MGNPKRALPDDYESRIAVMRQATREMNEAAQNARVAARELTEAQKLTEMTAEKTIVAVITPICSDVTEGMNKLFKAAERRIDFQEKHLQEITVICSETLGTMIKDAEARLMGYKDAAALEQHIIQQIHRSMHELGRDPQFISDVADHVSTNIKFVASPSSHAPAEHRVQNVVSKAKEDVSGANDHPAITAAVKIVPRPTGI